MIINNIIFNIKNLRNAIITNAFNKPFNFIFNIKGHFLASTIYLNYGYYIT